MKYHVKVIDYGIRLNYKFGITGEMTSLLTEEQIRLNIINTAKRPPVRGVQPYCKIESLDGRQREVDQIVESVK